MVQVGEVMGESDRQPQPITVSSAQIGSGMAQKGGVGVVQEEGVQVVSSEESLSTIGPVTRKDDSDLTPLSLNVQGSGGVVRLLHSVKIPAGFKKMVRAKLSQGVSANNSLWLLTSHLQPTGLTLADSLVECRDNAPCLMIVIQNHGKEAVRLKKE